MADDKLMDEHGSELLQAFNEGKFQQVTDQVEIHLKKYDDSTFGFRVRGVQISFFGRLIGFTFVQNFYKGCGCLRAQSKNPVTPSLYERDDKDCIDSPWRN